jgi:MFS family permease
VGRFEADVGVLMDRFHPRHLSAFGFAVAALGVLAILGAAHSEAWLPMAGRSLSGASASAARSAAGDRLGGNYFGRQHLGRIRSVALPFTIVFGAGEPLLAGELYDRSGTYTVAFLLFGLFWLIGFVVILLARPPRHPSQRVVELQHDASETAAAAT